MDRECSKSEQRRPWTGKDYTQIMVSMSEAAKCAFASLGSVETVRSYCNCTNGCYGDNRCKCFKKKYNCTSHCHPKLMGKTC
jgi:hypothetical protein